MSVRATIDDLVDSALLQIDRVLPPGSREKAYSKTMDFATARPLFFSFIVAQTIFSLMPVLFFVAFVGSVLMLAITTSLLFTLFWTGIALFFLVPVLALTSGVALFTWACGVAIYSASRWFFESMQDMAQPEPGHPHRKVSITAGPHNEEYDSSQSSSDPASWTDVKKGPKLQIKVERDFKLEFEKDEKSPAQPNPEADVGEPKP